MKVYSSRYWLVFFVALSARILLWTFIIAHPERALDNDSALYIGLAEDLLNRHAFLSILRTPVYPLFIAAIYHISGRSYEAVLFPQCVLDSFTATATALIFFRLFKGRRYSIVAGLMYGLNPFAIYFCNKILTETLFAFLLVIMFYFLACFFDTQRRVYLAISSIMLGLSALCRPIALYSALLTVSALFFVRNEVKKKFICCALFILCFSAVVTPWFLRNYHFCHRWILSTIDEMNYFISFAPEVLMIENDPFSIVQVRINEPIEHYKEILWNKVKSEHGWHENGPLELGNDAQRVALLSAEGKKVILQRPVIFLASHALNILRTLCPYYPPFSKLTGKDVGIISALSFIIDMLTVGLFFLGSFFCVQGELLQDSNKVLIYLMIAMILYFSFIPGIVGYNRFRVPILSYICILSSLGLGKICHFVNIRKT